MCLPNMDVFGERSIEVLASWSDESISTLVTRPVAECRVGVIEPGRIPEVIDGAIRGNRAHSAVVGLISQGAQAGGVTQLRDVVRCAIGQGEDTSELPTSNDLAENASCYIGPTRTEGQVVKVRSNKATRQVEL